MPQDQLHVFHASTHDPDRGVISNPFSYMSSSGQEVLGFPNTYTSRAIFHTVLSRLYNGAGIQARVIWYSQNGTTGNVRWNGAFERHEIGVTDLTVTAGTWGAVTSVEEAVPAILGTSKATILTFTDGTAMDGLQRGEDFRFYIERQPGGETNSHNGWALILSVELRNLV